MVNTIDYGLSFAVSLKKLFPSNEESRRYFEPKSPWSFGELRTIHAFEFHYKQRQPEHMEALGTAGIWLHFYSFRKRLPFKIEYSVTDAFNIRDIDYIRPTYLYPDCDEGLEEELALEAEDEAKVESLCRPVECGGQEVKDGLKIIEELCEISSDKALSTEHPAPAPHPSVHGY